MRAWMGIGLALAAAPAVADELPFEVMELTPSGRIVAAEIADLDGDGRGDVFAISVRGLPPDETRTVRVHYQRPDGSLPETPDHLEPVPAGAAIYDMGPIDDEPGDELIFLRRDDLALVSLAGRRPSRRSLALPRTPTAGAHPDERGLDRLRVLRPALGGARLLVPGIGEVTVLDRDGEVLGRLEVAGRANFFIPPRPGPVIGENELEMFFDVPRLNVGDVDGDGRADIVTSSRYEIRVFRQRPDGRFPTEPDISHPLRLVSSEDLVRSSGTARVDLRDLDGDGRADLLITHASGGLMSATTQTRVHRNRGGDWDLGDPDQLFESEGGYATDELIDLDGDGRPELMRIFMPLDVLELVEMFLQRAIDAEAALHRIDAQGRFEAEPSFRRSYGVALNFDTMRPAGFIPTLGEDWNGDGHRDLFSSGSGKAIEVYLGGPRFGYDKRRARQPLDTGGTIRFGDLDRDGLPDWVLHDPRGPGSPVRVGRNRGVLPGTPPGVRAVAAQPRSESP